MKQVTTNILATFIALSVAWPVALHARPDENEENKNDYNFASELVILDQTGIDELAKNGYEFAYGNDELASHIIDYAEQHLGQPYRSGGKGPSGFDCSGFTSYIFRKYGIDLNSSSKAQFLQGTKIAKDEIQPGDLLFFGGRSGGKTVGHVALAVEVDDNGVVTFIHAASNQGIRYDKYPDGGYYSRRYLGARRVLHPSDHAVAD